MYRCVGLLDMHGAPYNMVFGKDEMILSAFVIGADGGVGSTYNIPFMAPIYSSLLSSFQSLDLKTAAAQQKRSRDLVQLLHVYGNGALKAILQLSGFDYGQPRPPIDALTKDQVTALHADLVRLGFL